MQKEYKVDGVSLQDIQSKLCEILDELDYICRKHDIKYSIEGGTLLGAVKYKGFVPWDDDIDVVFLREEYERFVEACKTDLSDKFFLQTVKTDKEFPLNYAKLRYNDTLYRQINYTALNMHHGLFIDIYPLDDVGIKEYRNRIHLLGLLNGGKIKKHGIYMVKNSIVKRMLYTFMSWLPYSFLNNCIEKIMKHPVKNAKYVYPMFNPLHNLKPQLKSRYEKYIDLEFNGKKYMAIKEYEALLRESFGDYINEEPDSETRGPSHAVAECSLPCDRKVGIMTFHEANNYGAVLQAFALTRAISKLGKKVGKPVDCEIIDYTNDMVFNRYKIRKLREIPRLKTKVKHLLTLRYKIGDKACFDRFRDVFLHISKKKYNKENIAEANYNYDVVVSGSDQVFNGLLTANDAEYFLKFGFDDVQKVAYAASIGDESQVSENKELFSLVNNFDALSLREEKAQQVLQDNGYGTFPIVIDPSLLLDSSEYNVITHRLKNRKKKYILLYVIALENRVFQFAKELAKKKNCEIVYINGGQIHKFGVKNKRHVSVPEFLNLIKNAEYVVTSSFHGVAFSLVYHTKFYYQLSNSPKNFNSRIETLVNMSGVADCMVPKTGDFSEFNFDWDDIDRRIKEKRNEANQFIIDNIICAKQDDEKRFV